LISESAFVKGYGTIENDLERYFHDF